MTPDDLDHTAKLASERGLTAELRAGVMLVDFFLTGERPNVELPSGPSPAVERIVEMARRLLTAEGYCLEIHRPPRFAMFFYDLRLRSSWRYAIEGIGRALFFPSDWYRVDLPDALFPLYAAVRPVSWLVCGIRPGVRRDTKRVALHATFHHKSAAREKPHAIPPYKDILEGKKVRLNENLS